MVSTTGGCVSGPTGKNVEEWDMQPGNTYTITIDQATDCANGGTDASINVMVKNSFLGNTDIVATKVATGVYEFNYTMPGNGCETSPIVYCLTTPGQPNSGAGTVGRHDTGASQAHLRASNFGASCTKPVEITCPATPVRLPSWGVLRGRYR